MKTIYIFSLLVLIVNMVPCVTGNPPRLRSLTLNFSISNLASYGIFLQYHMEVSKVIVRAVI